MRYDAAYTDKNKATVKNIERAAAPAGSHIIISPVL